MGRMTPSKAKRMWSGSVMRIKFQEDEGGDKIKRIREGIV